MNSWRAPNRILPAHLLNESPQLRLDLPATNRTLRFPAPKSPSPALCQPITVSGRTIRIDPN